jgi:beta-N-acetylhexosaminidase
MLGSLLIDVAGTELTSEDKTLLQHPAVGGVILFARNIIDREQITQLTQDIRHTAPDVLITVDQEGGRVQRLLSGFTRLPSLKIIGTLFDTDAEAAAALALNVGWLMASEVLSVGIDLSFAPVCDCARLNTNIGTRALHANPFVVAYLATAYAQGMREAGMAACAKHFPGHGTVEADSHLNLPHDNREKNVIFQDDMFPFTQMIKAGVEAIMPAHIIFSDVDTLPVGFSSLWLKDILRAQLGFQGTIISDDLSMKATLPFGTITARVQKTLNAGANLVLLCNDRLAVLTVLENITEWPNQAEWINPLRAKQKPSFVDLMLEERWHHTFSQLQPLTA